jgi:hypothetical protein
MGYAEHMLWTFSALPSFPTNPILSPLPPTKCLAVGDGPSSSLKHGYLVFLPRKTFPLHLAVSVATNSWRGDKTE